MSLARWLISGSGVCARAAVCAVGVTDTGPMYCKYNTVLRDIGHLHEKARLHSMQSAKEISDELKRYQAEKEDEFRYGRGNGGAESERGRVRDSSERFPGHTHGNLYTTTLHLINSAVLKLGKLTKAQPVYRGISFRTLPKKLKRKKPDNTRGGIEFGFTSCSLSEKVANAYANPDVQRGDLQNTPIILAMSMGMIDRGADLTELSQYPHEKVCAHSHALTGRAGIGLRWRPCPACVCVCIWKHRRSCSHRCSASKSPSSVSSTMSSGSTCARR